MILSDRSIREELDAGRIVIDPLGANAIQPSSVDLHVDRHFPVFRNDTTGSVDTLSEAVDSFDRALQGVAVSYAVLTAAAILYVVVVGQLTRRQEQAMARADAGRAGAGGGGLAAMPGSSGWAITGMSGPSTWPAPVDRQPGWKSDPSRQAYYRWWDGQRWGHETSNGA